MKIYPISIALGASLGGGICLLFIDHGAFLGVWLIATSVWGIVERHYELSESTNE